MARHRCRSVRLDYCNFHHQRLVTGIKRSSMPKYIDDLEIPLGKRTKFYRFFEMVPAIISYGAFALLIVFSIVSPLLAAIYLLLVIVILLVRAVGIVYHTL